MSYNSANNNVLRYKFMCTCGHGAGVYARTMYMSSTNLPEATSAKTASVESLTLRKKYEDAIFENKEEFKHRTRLLEKDHLENISEKERLVTSLRKVVFDLQGQLRDKEMLGVPPTLAAKSTLHRLIDQIEQLQTDKQRLLRMLTEFKVTGSDELLRDSPIYQHSTPFQGHHQQQTTQSHTAESGHNQLGQCTTDTEKELQQTVLRKNALEDEVLQLRKDNKDLHQRLLKPGEPDANHNVQPPPDDAAVSSSTAPVECQHLVGNHFSEPRDTTEENPPAEEVASLREQIEHLKLEVIQKTQQLEQTESELNERIATLKQEKMAIEGEAQNKMAAEEEKWSASHAASVKRVWEVFQEFQRVKESYTALREQMVAVPLSLGHFMSCIQQQVAQSLENLASANREIVQKYLKEMRLRKTFHNQLVELRGNIRVLCRIRPCIPEDDVTDDHDLPVIPDLQDDGLVKVNHKGRFQEFDFDKVFGIESTQTQIFDEVSSLVRSVIDGFNVCIFAYGQTGSGKTYTMEGPPSAPGINQRSLQVLFEETKGDNWHYDISASVMEIYNEAIRDLLNPDPNNRLEVKMKPEGGLHVPGLETRAVSSLEEINQVFQTGRRNRATACTNMNEHSSRSHCLLCVSVGGYNPTTGSSTFGRLNLVDLAGSERVSKSHADGARLKETQSINRSLACLGDVIHALRSKRNHVPYRNSKLTYLLQDSLGGDSKTLMIVQVSPVEKNVAESLCTLSFGQRVKSVELGPAHRSVDGKPPKKGKRRTTTKNPRPSTLNLSISTTSSPSPSAYSSHNSSFTSYLSSGPSSPNSSVYDDSRTPSPYFDFSPVFSSSIASSPSSTCTTPTPQSPPTTPPSSLMVPVPKPKKIVSSSTSSFRTPPTAPSARRPQKPWSTSSPAATTPKPVKKSNGIQRSATFTVRGANNKR